MFDFLVRKQVIQGAQKWIDKLEPAVNVHVPPELPLPSARRLKKMSENVAKINGLEEEMKALTDDQLREKTDEFKSRYLSSLVKEQKEYQAIQKKYQETIRQDEKEEIQIELEKIEKVYRDKKQKILRELLPEAFAVVRETGCRVLGMRHYDVQLVGGMVLHNGNIAEMTTGEGKTLVATLPSYLNALTGEGVHIVTVNDYLAERDRDWMGPLFEFHGLTVGVIKHNMSPAERKKNYACDITYGTNNEFGFDYLRDNMVNYKEDMVQRPHHFAVVDEVDSILVDEARTPLIISGPAEESTDKYYRAFQISKQLKGRRITEKDEVEAKYKEIDLGEGYDYLADEKSKSVSLTDAGEEKASELFGVENMHDMATIEYRHHVLQALKAKEFFTLDVDYVVQEGQVIIVDEFTGRLMPGRRWSDGLHQAVEAKEGIKIERENQTLASITFQNYFRLYEKLSGMTGTAYTEATEFSQIYELDVIVVPTNRPLKRKNYPDQIYRSQKEKFTAVVDEIERCYKSGQPVLVGTISIEKSELISTLLKQRGVLHQVLNAKHHDREATIISQAGRLKAVTIATNMAGRGTDIVLGGNPEYLAKAIVDQKKEIEDEERERLIDEYIQEFSGQCVEENKKVKELGGLHVLGTERHEARRIDNQLRGRQGRQGDPGSSVFYVSLEDDLMRLFASDKIVGMMDKLGMEEGQVLEHSWLTGAIENAQRRVEGHNFEIRKHLLEFDNVMNRQREVIYSLRRSILESQDVKYMIMEAIDEAVASSVAQYLFNVRRETEDECDLEGFELYFKSSFDFEIPADMREKLLEMSQEEVVEYCVKELKALYDRKEEDIEADRLRHLERMLMMHTIDSKWKDHLYAMDQLKEGINLRAFGQRDPIIEYKKEGFAMFEEMYATIFLEVAELIFRIRPAAQPYRPRGVFTSVPQQMIHDDAQGLSESATRTSGGPAVPSAGALNPQKNRQSSGSVKNEHGEKVGRNDPCPCGSGKKYKKCCGQ